MKLIREEPTTVEPIKEVSFSHAYNTSKKLKLTPVEDTIYVEFHHPDCPTQIIVLSNEEARHLVDILPELVRQIS